MENYTLIPLEDFREELPEIARMAVEYRDQAIKVAEDHRIAAAKFNLLEVMSTHFKTLVTSRPSLVLWHFKL